MTVAQSQGLPFKAIDRSIA